MVETRYWKKIGMRVTKQMAMEFAGRMNLAATFLDDEIEEFTAVTHESGDADAEIEQLFSLPDEYPDGSEPIDPSVAVILKANEWTKERKIRVAELKEELKEEILALRAEEVAAMVEEENLSEDEASEKWDDNLKSRCIQEAKIKWDAEFNEKIESYQAELGLNTE